MKLEDTKELMLNDYYKNRFIAEYVQTKIRYERLLKIIIKIEAGKSSFNNSCSLGLLCKQAKAMGEYLHCLEIRAEIENIDLNIEIDS